MNTDKHKKWVETMKQVGKVCDIHPEVTDEFIEIASNALQEQEAGHKMKLENIAKEIETIDFKEKHICRFNDGTQNCECYLQGLEDALSIIEKHLSRQEEE